MELSQVLLKPLNTEKSVRLADMQQYAFMVHPSATKPEIVRAIQTFYGLKPLSCRVLKIQAKENGKRLKKHAGKKALLTFPKQSKFDPHKIK